MSQITEGISAYVTKKIRELTGTLTPPGLYRSYKNREEPPNIFDSRFHKNSDYRFPAQTFDKKEELIKWIMFVIFILGTVVAVILAIIS